MNKFFVIVVNTCVCRRFVDNKVLILSYPIQGVSRGYNELQRVTRGYKSYKGLQGVTKSYTGLQGVTQGYRR